MLNVSEVLNILEKEGLTSSRQVVLRWIRQGDLPAIQKTRKEGYQVAQSDLDEFIAKKKVSGLTPHSFLQQIFYGCLVACLIVVGCLFGGFGACS